MKALEHLHLKHRLVPGSEVGD